MLHSTVKSKAAYNTRSKISGRMSPIADPKSGCDALVNRSDQSVVNAEDSLENTEMNGENLRSET